MEFYDNYDFLIVEDDKYDLETLHTLLARAEDFYSRGWYDVIPNSVRIITECLIENIAEFKEIAIVKNDNHKETDYFQTLKNIMDNLCVDKKLRQQFFDIRKRGNKGSHYRYYSCINTKVLYEDSTKMLFSIFEIVVWYFNLLYPDKVIRTKYKTPVKIQDRKITERSSEELLKENYAIKKKFEELEEIAKEKIDENNYLRNQKIQFDAQYDLISEELDALQEENAELKKDKKRIIKDEKSLQELSKIKSKMQIVEDENESLKQTLEFSKKEILDLKLENEKIIKQKNKVVISKENKDDLKEEVVFLKNELEYKNIKCERLQRKVADDASRLLANEKEIKHLKINIKEQQDFKVKEKVLLDKNSELFKENVLLKNKIKFNKDLVEKGEALLKENKSLKNENFDLVEKVYSLEKNISDLIEACKEKINYDTDLINKELTYKDLVYEIVVFFAQTGTYCTKNTVYYYLVGSIQPFLSVSGTNEYFGKLSRSEISPLECGDYLSQLVLQNKIETNQNGFYIPVINKDVEPKCGDINLQAKVNVWDKIKQEKENKQITKKNEKVTNKSFFSMSKAERDTFMTNLKMRNEWWKEYQKGKASQQEETNQNTKEQ